MSGPFSEQDLRDLQRMGGPQYAGFWIRVAAALIDGVLIACVTLPLTFAVYGWEMLESERFILGRMDVVINYVLPAVVTVIFWIYRSATPGKMLLGLRVVDASTGQGLGTGQAMLRYLAYVPALLVLGLGIAWVAFDARKQGWHDKLARTVVLQK